MRQLIDVGTPRDLQWRLGAVLAALPALILSLREIAGRYGRRVRHVSLLKRRSIARPGGVHIGVRETNAPIQSPNRSNAPARIGRSEARCSSESTSQCSAIRRTILQELGTARNRASCSTSATPSKSGRAHEPSATTRNSSCAIESSRLLASCAATAARNSSSVRRISSVVAPNRFC